MKMHDDNTITLVASLCCLAPCLFAFCIHRRRDSFITHRAFCDALAEESSRSMPQTAPNNQAHIHGFHHHPLLPLKQETLNFSLPPWLSSDPQNSVNPFQDTQNHPNAAFYPAAPSLMSATALLQKAAQMGVTMSGSGKMAYQPPSDHDVHNNRDPTAVILGGRNPPQQHHVGAQGFCATSSAATAGLPSREEFVHGLAEYGGKLANLTAGCMETSSAMQENMAMAAAANSLPSTSGYQGFDDSFNGIFNTKRNLQSFQQDAAFMGLRKEGGASASAAAGGGSDGMTRDFLGLRAFPHRDFSNMAGLDQMGNSSASFDHQNQAPWQS